MSSLKIPVLDEVNSTSFYNGIRYHTTKYGSFYLLDNKPTLLDLYCGVGGASMGYSYAGFQVIGVDINPQPDYPFQFIQADAIWFLRDYANIFDVVHASPPCQAYTWGTRKGRENKFPDLVELTRYFLDFQNPSFIIENVPQAPLIDPITLCGAMFDLEVIRHRNFEIHPPLLSQPKHKPHNGTVRDGTYITVAGHGGDSKRYGIADIQRAMGIDWTRNKQSLVEAIPPAYTEFIGKELLMSVRR